jgi:outer membrane protein assembly factor BamB
VLLVNDMDKEDQAKKVPVKRPSFVLALNKKTGAIAWEVPREAFRACYSAPFLNTAKGEMPEMIVASTTAITAYNPDNGSKIWEMPHWQSKTVPMPLRTVATPTLVGEVLVITSGDGSGPRYAAGIAIGTGAHRLWENNKDFPYVPCALTRGQHIYFVNDKGLAGCYEAETGKRVWQERQQDANFTASPLLINGKLYAASQEGDVFVLPAEPTFQLLARNKIGEGIRATPAVARDRLYIRGQQHLYCIGK